MKNNYKRQIIHEINKLYYKYAKRKIFITIFDEKLAKTDESQMLFHWKLEQKYPKAKFISSALVRFPRWSRLISEINNNIFDTNKREQ